MGQRAQGRALAGRCEQKTTMSVYTYMHTRYMCENVLLKPIILCAKKKCF